MESTGTKYQKGMDTAEVAKRVRALLKQLEGIAEEYRRDDSDIQTDYFNCNFYLHVKFDHELEREDRETMKAYYAALPASHLRLVG